MSSKRSASMTTGISIGLETYLILGQGSHNLLYWKKSPDGYMWSGRRLTRKQLTSRPVYLWPELWKSMGKHTKLTEERIHLENARKLRGISFIDPEDTEFKETIKNAPRVIRKTRSTPSPFLISSPSRTFTSGRAGHTITGTGRKVVKNAALQINSKRSAGRNNSWTFTIDSFVTHGSENPCWNWVALKKWFARWTDWRSKTTPILPQKKNSMFFFFGAIGGYVRI